MTTPEKVAVAVGLLTIIVILIGFFRWLAPRWHSASKTWVAFRDTFLGREAITDSTTPGRVIEPALPPLGVRMSKVEIAVAQLADQQRRLNNHEDRIVSLEQARVERVVTQAESAAMWQAVDRLHEVDPTRPDPPETPDPSEP